MSLDVYVGNLSRYLARDWLTPTQRLAVELGVEVRSEHDDQLQTQAFSANPESRAAVEQWQGGLAAALDAQTL